MLQTSRGHTPLLPPASHPITTLSSAPKAKSLACEGTGALRAPETPILKTLGYRASALRPG